VIPGVGNLNAFALGKYEVSVEEFQQYCQVTRVCEVPFDSNLSVPITRITLQMAQEYIVWLSKESGKTYRLPTLEEWTLAARAKGRGLDSNRNCYLDSRGLQKGGALISAGIGQQNGWGLVNYVGNAREWVTAGGGQIYVVGGSYKTDMDQCDLNWKRSSDGQADVETGFRVLRELSK
jgi:formylglycine-generating enzyme required for sulfatase activity